MVVATCPITVASKRSPTSVRTTTIVLVGRIAFYRGGCTLPKHGICGVPSRSKLELFEIGKSQVIPINVDDVEQ